MLVTQSNSPITTTQVGYSNGWKAFWLLRIKERGKELKVPHYTNTAAAYDGNLPYIKAACLI